MGFAVGDQKTIEAFVALMQKHFKVGKVEWNDFLYRGLQVSVTKKGVTVDMQDYVVREIEPLMENFMPGQIPGEAQLPVRVPKNRLHETLNPANQAMYRS